MMQIETRHQVTAASFMLWGVPVTLWASTDAIGVRIPGFKWEVKPCNH